jgi:tRNA-specific 2-thiouridylase
MKNWDESATDGRCMWEADVEDAMHVCDTLEIPINTVDLSKEYWGNVFELFLQEYKTGRTPNPDILCNQEIKFKAFLDHALDFGATKIATGHYAQIIDTDDDYQLHKGIDVNKDQSYFLCRLNQEQLGHALFPIGKIEKTEVRSLAKKAGFITHDKKDSTGICFVGEQPFREFLSHYIPIKKGDIQTSEGTTIGEHDGVHLYTLGQRQGLGIGGIQDASDEPWYVIRKDMENNILIAAQGHDHPLLFSQTLIATNMHWINEDTPKMPLICTAKTRYRQADQNCTIEQLNNDECKVQFDQPQRAVTPGQFVVFYQGLNCLGGGVIESTA